MNKEEKIAFEKILKKMQEIRKLQNLEDNTKFTVLNLEMLAQNHSFDNPIASELFGITEHEGKLIRSYFNKYEQYQYVNDLYREFPGVFEGEFKKRFIYKENLKKLDKNITLFN